MFTLDTNILIYYGKGDSAIADVLLEQLETGAVLFLPTIAVVEFLSFPALTLQEREFFVNLFSQLTIVSLDLEISLAAADLRRVHDMKLGDSVIAATTLATHSTLMTRNIRDFKKVTGLPLLKM